MTPEQKFWQLLKSHVPGHVNRIENTVSSGIPDVNYCYKGREVWLELKAGSKVRDSQYIWHHQRTLQGGIVLLIERLGNQITIRQATRDFKIYNTLASLHKPWDWLAVTAILGGDSYLLKGWDEDK